MALLTRSRRRLQSSAPFLIVILAGAGAAFFIIPLLGLLLRTPWTSAWQQFGSAEVLAALRLSLLASVSATAIALVLGVPLAWTFARLAFPGRSVLRALTVLPMVLPPVVGGVALLLAFGRRQCLAQLPAGPVIAKVARNFKPAAGDCYVRIESARGDMGWYVVSDGTAFPHRCKIRTGSFAAMSIIQKVSRNLMIADLIAVIASFDLVAPEIDR